MFNIIIIYTYEQVTYIQMSKSKRLQRGKLHVLPLYVVVV